MPVRTTPNLSIRALPLQGIARAQWQQQQMLSPSALRQPTTELFALQVSTLPPLPLRKRYVVNVQRTSRLMRKSALFHDLASQYATLAASGYNNDDGDSYGYLPSQQLPTICIEAPVRSDNADIVDAVFEWLFSDNDDMNAGNAGNDENALNALNAGNTGNAMNAADIALGSALAPRIRGPRDFFALIHFATLLNLFEPYCSTIDSLLVYYYFGLSPDERRKTIVQSDQFVEGVLPGRFARRLAEVVSEEEAQEMIASFFRNRRQPFNVEGSGANDSYIHLAFHNTLSPQTPTTYDEHVLRSLKRERTSYFAAMPSPSSSFFSSPFTSSPLSTPTSELISSPFDHAEPPTPRGSACMFVPPTTPLTPDVQRIVPRAKPVQPYVSHLPQRVSNRSSQCVGAPNRAFGTPMTPTTPFTKTFKATAAPPNTPETATLPTSFDDEKNESLVTAVPPNTPKTPTTTTTSQTTARSVPDANASVPTKPAASSPPLPPSTPTIKINGNDHYDADDDDDRSGDSNRSNLSSPKRPTPSLLQRASSYAFIRRELFEFALSKMRKRASV